jgi:teichuronic acid exporter
VSRRPWSRALRSGLSASLVDRIVADKLLRGFGALGLGELAVRVSRIATTIVLARYLTAAELGVAATALACFELVRVLANNGIGQMVVRVPEELLAAMCNTAWRLSWAVCAAMALIQIAAGLVIAYSAGRPELVGMIFALAGVYLFMPWAMVHSWLLQRQYRMGRISAVNAAQVCTDNVLTAGFAVAGFGPWAIVLPKLLTAPIWMLGMRLGVSWRYDRSAGTVGLSQIVRFCAPILASEVLVAVRFNIDKMLVGAILGIEALGIYYFAFSAGYGLSLVLTSALSAAAFPHLADHRLSGRELLARFDRALLKLALPIAGLIGLQSLAVFIYVPLLFGQKWEPMTAIVAVLCLSAATKAWHDLSAQLLRAAGVPGYELIASALFTGVLLGSFSLGLTQGLLFGVAMMSIATISMQLTFTAWARRVVAKRVREAEPNESLAPAGFAAAKV